MKNVLSVLIFLGFMLLCAWEVVPKFWDVAMQDNGKVLFTAEAEKSDAVNRHTKDDSGKESMDYRRLIEGINTDGA